MSNVRSERQTGTVRTRSVERLVAAAPAIAACAWLCTVTMAAQVPAGRTVWDGVYTTEQATRGAQVYMTQCASCHGESLGGLDQAPALTGDQFGSTWTGTTLGDLGERIRTSMPLGNPGTVSRPQLGELLAYLLKAGGFPAGQAPLDPQTSLLGTIRYEAIRPQPK